MHPRRRRRRRGPARHRGRLRARHSRAHPAPVRLRGRIAAGGAARPRARLRLRASGQERAAIRFGGSRAARKRAKNQPTAATRSAERPRGVSIARNASGVAKAATHASADRTTIVRWPLGATSTLGAQASVARDCAGRGAVGAGQSAVQQSIVDAAAALTAAEHPMPPTEPAKISASSTAASLRMGKSVAVARPSGNPAWRQASLYSAVALGYDWDLGLAEWT